MTEKPKFDPVVIPFRGARLAFAKIHKAEARRAKPGQQVSQDAPRFYSAEYLFDPTNVDHQKTIQMIKDESVRALNHRFGTSQNPAPFTVAALEAMAKGERIPPGWHLCWGYGNALPAFGKKIYDGYKDRFFVRVKRPEKDGRPILLNREGKPVVEGDPQCPYSGCIVAGTLTIWSYDNESKGVNATLRTIVFQDDGPAFGGGSIDADSEFAMLGDLGPVASEGSAPLNDPFAI